MKKETLIKGTFKPEEATEILMNIFSNKIQFHNLKNFSSLERNGKEDSIAKKRIPQLKKSVEKISAILKKAKSKKKHLNIYADVTIELIDSIEKK